MPELNIHLPKPALSVYKKSPIGCESSKIYVGNLDLSSLEVGYDYYTYSKFHAMGMQPDVKIIRSGNLISAERSYSPTRQITQQVIDFGDSKLKTTVNKSRRLRLVQSQTKEGVFSTTRLIGNEVVGGYQMTPIVRKFSSGIKGTLENIALKIGTNSKGCERPLLRNLAAKLFSYAQKIK